jgi:CheY-like chemotaxis protein
MKSGRVLIVDDQIEFAENIAEILEGLGFETDVATEALSQRRRIETAVVDYRP